MGCTFSRDTPCPRVFHCRLCDVRVYVDDPLDRRTVFCCEDHEVKWWKHSARYKKKSKQRRTDENE